MQKIITYALLTTVLASQITFAQTTSPAISLPTSSVPTTTTTPNPAAPGTAVSQTSTPSTAPVSQEQQDVQLFLKSLSDTTVTPPAVLARFRTAGVAYVKAEAAYMEELKGLYPWVTSLAERTLSTPAQAKGIVKEIDKKIQKLNGARNTRDAQLQKFTKQISQANLPAPLKSLLSSSFSLTDEQRMTELRKAFHTTSLDMLYATKAFYTTLSKTKSRFSSINHHFIFDSSLLKLQYFDYITQIRAAAQRAVVAENDLIAVYEKNAQTVEVFYGKGFMEQFLELKKVNDSLVAIWNGTGTLPEQATPAAAPVVQGQTAPVVAPQGELTRRVDADAQIATIAAEIKILSADFSKKAWISKESLATKETIRTAIASGKAMTALLERLEKREYDIRLQYEREYATPLNFLAASVLMSDTEFTSVLVEVQKQAATLESVTFDVEVHTIALAQFGSFTQNYDNPNAQYRITFVKPHIQTRYVRMVDAYNQKYKLYIESESTPAEPAAPALPNS